MRSIPIISTAAQQREQTFTRRTGSSRSATIYSVRPLHTTLDVPGRRTWAWSPGRKAQHVPQRLVRSRGWL